MANVFFPVVFIAFVPILDVVAILHSKNDEVIPFANSMELVRGSGLPTYTLIEVGSDHRLADPESLDMMLAGCLIGEDEPDVEELDILEMD